MEQDKPAHLQKREQEPNNSRERAFQFRTRKSRQRATGGTLPEAIALSQSGQINRAIEQKMSDKTNIQWCHSTTNPAMGCNGCELWPSSSKIASAMNQELTNSLSKPTEDFKASVRQVLGDRGTGEIYRDRELIADRLKEKLKLTKAQREGLVDVVRRLCKCYAGLLGTMRAGHKGYADSFDRPKLFPGRMAKAAKLRTPSPAEQVEKPWLESAPRMIFVSDMGDILSEGISFAYLDEEIITSVRSPEGRRHLWLWLTKRPHNMAKFGQWLHQQGKDWPENLVAMTTVTSKSTLGRIDALREVPARFRGLSIEPLYTPLILDLGGIDWVIVGGGSDTLAEPFHVEWAQDIRSQCEVAGTAFFLKQLGKNPMYKGLPLDLKHRHGGDWSAWPAHLRVREIPDGFRTYKSQ